MARRLRLEDLTAIAVPEEPAISPDGSEIVYVLRRCDRTTEVADVDEQERDTDRDVRALWRVATACGGPRRLTAGPADTAPAYSPDGAWIAFLREVDGRPQVWRLPLDGGDPEQLTRLPLGAGCPVWSPDGTRLAFSALVESGGAAPAHAPLVADTLDYQVDGVGLGTGRRHVHVLDLAAGSVVPVTEGEWNTGEPAWSPGGDRLAFSGTYGPDPDLTWRSAAYVLDLAKPDASPEPVGSTEGMAGPVTWAGDALLVVGRDRPAAGHLRLLRVSLVGHPTTDLGALLDRNVMPGSSGYPGALPQVTPKDRAALFCVREAGETHLYSVDLVSGHLRALVEGAGRSVSGVAVARAAECAAIVLSTPDRYGEIAVVDPVAGTERVLTAHGAAALPDVELYPAVDRYFTISDGAEVHGRLIRDPRTTGPSPLLLDIHGGPHNAWGGAADPVHLYHQVLAERGWTILLLNPRASDGYGEDFYRAALGAWGEADRKDFLEPLDQLVAEGVADPHRLAIAGYSYGGFMTCYLTAHDDRFAAAVTGGPVADLTSMVGTSDFGAYMAGTQLGSPPWANPARFAELSPLTEVANVMTPTLVLQGTADRRCPMGQAQQWFTALRERRVPTRLVLYPEASHLFFRCGRPSHRLDWNRRIVDWVEQHAAP
ncbi:S9 family peptidase [Embleya sp. NBC_00896]|uniref:S9 family peptidase n=1 Tax=Embleya sp. NBC_00896 TaxID=2975961 RepID=UPI002F908135|nr:S9 family peptidase [Embleya sp. NBC_00896]